MITNHTPSHTAMMVIIVGLIGMTLFAAISYAVINTDPVLDLDATIAQAVYDAGQTPVKDFFDVFTLFGYQGAWVIGIGLGLILITLRMRVHLITWLLAQVGGEALNLALKALYARPRPAFPGWTQPETTYGYPSGHAMMAMITYGMLVVFAWEVVRRPLTRALIVTLAGTMIVLLSLSRIVLNAHFFSDVIGGALGGAIWLVTCAVVFVILWRAEVNPAPETMPAIAPGRSL